MNLRPLRCFLLAAVPLLLRAGEPSATPAIQVVEAAKAQVGVTVAYDGSYRRLKYPGGDVPMDLGVCTDVLIRAFRAAGVDLQVLVHEDMKRAFDKYPKRWGLKSPDPNIDHRRALNLMAFFTRQGKGLPVSTKAEDYLPGDVVAWRLPSGREHVGIVSDAPSRDPKRMLVVHNLWAGAKLEDILFEYPILGHYRYFQSRAEKGKV